MAEYTPSPQAVEAFRAAWHEADAEGDEGNRVSRGLAAALAHHDAELRAEVERLREVSAAQPYETERELAVALDEARQQVADLRAEQERHALANDGCVPGAAYRDLAAAHADLRAGIEALADEYDDHRRPRGVHRFAVADRLRALLPGRTEAEVKAEALREAAAAIGTYDEGDVHLWARDADTWLLDRANRIEKEESRR